MREQHFHLKIETAALLAESDDNRIHHCRSEKWIPYSRAKEVLDRMEDLLHYPPRPRMPGMLIYGDTNNGKTSILGEFLRRHSPQDNPSGVTILVPVLYISCPPNPDEKSLYGIIFNKLFEPYRPKEPARELRYQVVKLLQQVGTRMILIDEMNQVVSTSLNQQRHIWDTIKFLSKELEASFVVAGTPEVNRSIATYDQIANRLPDEALHKWVEGEELYRLLISLEKLMPLKKPSFSIIDPSTDTVKARFDSHFVKELIGRSEGLLGEITYLISETATQAIRTGEEQLNLKMLRSVPLKRPGQRGK